jgi:hypothetical protein
MLQQNALEDLTIRLAVLEQLTLRMAAFLAEEAESPPHAIGVLVQDLRAEFAANASPKIQNFRERSYRHIDQVESRLLRLVGAETAA